MKFRGDGPDLGLLISASASQHCCFYGRQTAPPCTSWWPLVSCPGPRIQGLWWRHTCLSFSPSFQGFLLRIQSPWFSILFSHPHPRANLNIGSTLVKKQKYSHEAYFLVSRGRQWNKSRNRWMRYSWSWKTQGLGSLSFCTVRDLCIALQWALGTHDSLYIWVQRSTDCVLL